MQSVLIEDFIKHVEDNNLEVFKSSYLNQVLIDIKKGESGGIDFETFKSEISTMTPIEVIKKDLTREIVYIRESQVEWDGDIIKGDLGEYLQVNDGVYKDTDLNKSLGRVGLSYRDEPVIDEVILKAMDSIDIIKGKRGQLGEIRTWSGKKYQKTSSGWVPVKNQGGETSEKEEDDKSTTASTSGKIKTEKKMGAKAELKSKIDPKYHQYFKQWDANLRDNIFETSSQQSSYYKEKRALNDFYDYLEEEHDIKVDKTHRVKDERDYWNEQMERERKQRWEEKEKEYKEKEKAPKQSIQQGKTYNLPAKNGMPAISMTVKKIDGDNITVETKMGYKIRTSIHHREVIDSMINQ